MQTKSREQILREKRKFWNAHLQAWRNSGYSLAEYGRHYNLVYHRLIYWKTKSENEQPKSVTFVPVPLRTRSTDTAITLSLQNDRFTIAEIHKAGHAQLMYHLKKVISGQRKRINKKYRH